MVRILIAYYSLEGSTRAIAQQMAKESGGELLEIQPVKDFPTQAGWKLVVGGFHSTMNRPCPIKKFDLELESFDLLIIGTPVWAYRPSPPIVTFIKEKIPENKKVALFCTHRGSPRKALEIMTSLLGKNPVMGSLVINSGSEFTESNKDEVHEWIHNLLSV